MNFRSINPIDDLSDETDILFQVDVFDTGQMSLPVEHVAYEASSQISGHLADRHGIHIPPVPLKIATAPTREEAVEATLENWLAQYRALGFQSVSVIRGDSDRKYKINVRFERV